MAMARRAGRITRRNTAAGVGLLAALILVVAAALSRDDSGPVVRTVPLPQPSYLPVLDTRTGRAFIAQMNGGVVRMFDTRTDAPLRTIATAPPGASSTYLRLVDDEGLGRVYVLSARLWRAPFNSMKDCSIEEPSLDNEMRTTQQASRGGTRRGLKPADKSSASANHTAVDRPVLCPMLTRGTCV